MAKYTQQARQYKRELDVYNDFKDFCSEWLVFNGFPDWLVLQAGQPSMQGLRAPMLLLDFYDSERYGWTSTDYKWNTPIENFKGVVTTKWRRDIFMSFTFWKDRADMLENSKSDFDSSNSDIISDLWEDKEGEDKGEDETPPKTQEEVAQEKLEHEQELKAYSTAYDVANLFLGYLQGQSARDILAKLGYWTLVTPQIYNGIAEDDSGLPKYTRFPVIRTKFVVDERILLADPDNFVTKDNQQKAFRQNTWVIPVTS